MEPTRRSAIVWTATAPLVLTACGQAGLDQLAHGPSARVARVISGDSLTLEGGQVVRLAGLQAPRDEQIYGPEARAALTDLVGGHAVQLLYGGARQDVYGRAIAHLRLPTSGLWVQQALLEQGAARVRTYPDNRALARPMLDAEARARQAKRGLWTLLAYRVRLPREAAADPFGFQIVEGRVAGVQPGGDGATLDLEHWVAVHIPRPGAFAAAGAPLTDLTGRLIRVRADLRPAMGKAEMRLDHPEQLERLRE